MVECLTSVPTGKKDQQKQLGREALSIVGDCIQGICTCARNLGCNSAQDCYVPPGMDCVILFLLTCFAAQYVNMCGSSVLHKYRVLHSGWPEQPPASCLYFVQDKFLQRPINISVEGLESEDNSPYEIGLHVKCSDNNNMDIFLLQAYLLFKRYKSAVWIDFND